MILSVYAALQKADTVGMFQIESRAQMACLPRLRPQKFLRHRRAGSHHPARAHRGQDGASVFETAAGARARRVPASFAGTGAGAHAGRAAVSGAIAAHGHDCGGFHRRRS